MKTQNEIKGEFEKLEEIARRLYQLEYRPDINAYLAKPEYCMRYVNFVNGAWYAFQEQQKKIDKIVSLVWSETPDYDLDNKIKGILK